MTGPTAGIHKLGGILQPPHSQQLQKLDFFVPKLALLTITFSKPQHLMVS